MRSSISATFVALALLLGPAGTAVAGGNSARPCADCPPDESELPGHPVRGIVRKLVPERGAVLVQHEAIPDVMPAMTMEFQVEPELLKTLQPGTEILGRVEQRDSGWWLSHVRILVRKPATKS